MEILAFSGKKQSGKTTSSTYINQRFTGSRRFNFADTLKGIVMRCFGATFEQCYGSDADKNSLLPCGRSCREVLQLIGTDMFRKIDPECWVRAWKAGVLELQVKTKLANKVRLAVGEPSEDIPLIIVDDVRFPNEIEAIHSVGGKVIRFTRCPFKNEDLHASETALDEMEAVSLRDPNATINGQRFDAVIDNSSMSIDEQNDAVLNILQSEFKLRAFEGSKPDIRISR